MMETPRAVDVLVLGGGPAGAAAALALAARGVSVAVLERSRYDGERVGETLPPQVTPVLHRLGVWDAFVRDAHLPSPGIVSAWNDPEPADSDFIFNPYGHGWHVDRARFDRTLAECAERAGAAVVRAARVHACRRQADQRWSVSYGFDGTEREATAALLVDATGRSAWLARQQGARRTVLDQLVGVVGFGENAGDDDHRTVIEAAADGWWYSARLPGGRVVAAFMTDTDLIPRGRDRVRRFWLDHHASAPLTAALWPRADDVGQLRVTFSGTVRLDRFGGPGWLAVGDAALAYDPLSSRGILKALESGWRAAESAADLLRGDTAALDGYTEWLEAEFAAYTRSYRHYYGQVTRWPASVFWARRMG